MKNGPVFFTLVTMLLTFCLIARTRAAPVIVDTPDAHIIIIRPIDQWTGNKVSSKATLSDHANKRYFVRYQDSSGNLHSIKKTIFSGISDEKIFQNLVKSYPDRNIEVRTAQFSVGKPVTVTMQELNHFLAAQSDFFKASVINLGNPETLEDRNANKSKFSLILGLASGIHGVARHNENSYTTWSNTAAASALHAGQKTPLAAGLSADALKAITAVHIHKLDLSGYNTIGIRSLKMGGDRYGQLFVAYKHAKTAESENAVLLAALPILMGFDEPEDQIVAARQEDFELRKAIWKECVATGKCENDTSVEDVAALPTSNEKIKEAYRDWLQKRTPRAFVLSNNNRYNAAWGGSDPEKRALDACNARGNVICKTYAIDDKVVYVSSAKPSLANADPPGTMDIAEQFRQKGYLVRSVKTITPIFSQLLMIPLPSGFSPTFENTQGNHYIREAVLAGENINNWTQMITLTGIKDLAKRPNMTAQLFANSLAGNFKSACPTSFSARSLGERKISGYDAFVAIASCGMSPTTNGKTSETALITVIKGEKDFYTLQWAERTLPSMSPIAVDLAKWAKRFNKLMPIKVCPFKTGELPPYPSCVSQ